MLKWVLTKAFIRMQWALNISECICGLNANGFLICLWLINALFGLKYNLLLLLYVFFWFSEVIFIHNYLLTSTIKWNRIGHCGYIISNFPTQMIIGEPLMPCQTSSSSWGKYFLFITHFILFLLRFIMLIILAFPQLFLFF